MELDHLNYPYVCKDCTNKFEVIKSVRDIENIESCPSCHSDNTNRYIARTHFFGAGDWDRTEFNPAFGKVIRNSRHRKDEAKARGWEEVGNTEAENIHKHDEKLQDQLIEDNWRKV